MSLLANLKSLVLPQKSRRGRQHRRKNLRCETLHQRRMMAADIYLNNDTLVVAGDQNSDSIIVRNVGHDVTKFVDPTVIRSQLTLKYPLIEVQATDRTTGETQTQRFLSSEVSDLFIVTGDGENDVDVRVDKPSFIYGGSDNDILRGGNLDDEIIAGGGDDLVYGRAGFDTIEGGSGSDRIFGGANADELFGDDDRDYIYGGNGHDQIDGGEGSDWVYGENGNDVIDGGVGNDYLFGGNDDDQIDGMAGNDFVSGNNGNDSLHGWTGNDRILGGNGNDAINGGTGFDRSWSGAGEDRSLVVIGEGDIIYDQSSIDVQIDFRNTVEPLDVTLGSNFGEATATPAAWVDSELFQVDSALQLVFNATGNNALLHGPENSNLLFTRYSNVVGENSDLVNVGGWNSSSRNEIVILDLVATDSSIVDTVIHEIAHNFDQQSENPFIDDFRDAATWRIRRWYHSKNGYTQAEDAAWDNWYYQTSTADTFAREYGKTNPLEDFATSMTAKIMTDNGRNYAGENPDQVSQRMADRFDVIDDFFASLS